MKIFPPEKRIERVSLVSQETAVINKDVKGLGSAVPGSSFGKRVVKDFIRNRYVYFMALPILAYYLIFHYGPMYGAIIAFKDFNVGKGIWGSPWVGFKHFNDFFQSFYFWRVLKNTLLISVYSLLWGFPAPIILALLVNEIKNKFFKKTVQTVTYLPHFISIVVICGLIHDFVARDGIITNLLVFMGMERVNPLSKPEFFKTIYISSGVWQEVGWGSIIYLAALSAIENEQYEAATIDGAGRWKQLIHVTWPGLLPTVVILLILRLGHIMGVGFEKIMLLYNANTYDTADVISTFVYRKGLQGGFEFSFSTAVGLFNSAINFAMLLLSNWISKRFSEHSLW